MTKKDFYYLSWIFIRYGFLIYISSILLELNVLIPLVLIWIFVFLDLGVEFLKMIDDT
jgi:hypothetical protein